MNLEQLAASLQSKPNPETPQSCLIYGAPKTGKTTLAAVLAQKYNVIWIDLEKGYQTLFLSVPKELWHKITLIRVADVQDTSFGIKTVLAILRAKGSVSICDEHGRVSCPVCNVAKASFTTIDPTKWTTDTVLVTDSLTQLSDSAMAHVLGASPDGFVFKKKEFSHYDNQGLILKNILNAQQRLLCHSVFISHEEELEQEDGTKKLTPVGGTRNFSKIVSRYFDHVVYLSIRNKQHCINSTTVSDIRVQAGSRNQVDVKKLEDFVNIFAIKYSEQGKHATLEFAGESDVVGESAVANSEVSSAADPTPTPAATPTNALAARIAAMNANKP